MAQYAGANDTVLVVLLVTVCAIAVTSLSIFLTLICLRMFSLTDTPSHRSLHTTEIPRGAGMGLVAVWIGITLVLEPTSWSIWIIPVLFSVIGAIDDLRRTSASFKLWAQMLIAGSAGLWLQYSVGVALEWIPFIVLTLLVTVNATNFMDGINGISAFNALFIGVSYAVMFSWLGEKGFALQVFAFSTVVLAFLPWNFPSAKVFLGDSGSYFIGAVIGIFMLSLVISGQMIAAVLPFMTYFADVTWTLLKRIRKGRHIFLPHREHAYQRIAIESGSHAFAALIAAGFTGLSCLLALVAFGRSLSFSILVLAVGVGVNVLYLGIPRYLEKQTR